MTTGQAQAVAETQVTVGDLIARCQDAATKMGLGNPHRLLFVNAAYGLKQLVDRLADLEGQVAKIQQQPTPIAGVVMEEAGYGHAV